MQRPTPQEHLRSLQSEHAKACEEDPIDLAEMERCPGSEDAVRWGYLLAAGHALQSAEGFLGPALAGFERGAVVEMASAAAFLARWYVHWTLETGQAAPRAADRPHAPPHGHPHAKLNGDVVAEIRRRCAAGETQVKLAERFGVSQTTISRVVTGRTWAPVEDSEAARG